MNKNSRQQFLSRLDASRKSTFLVAEYLHRAGYSIHIPAFDYRGPNTDWRDHVDDGDLYIWREREDLHRIDVKHVSLSFTSAEDMPYPYMFVADARAIERADPFPLAYIIVNQPCTHFGIIWGKTKPHWENHKVYASNTDKVITVKRCPVEYVDFRSLTAEQGHGRRWDNAA